MTRPDTRRPARGRFRAAAVQALGDAQLGAALRNLAAVIGGRRRAAVENVADWEDLRERARAMKAATLEHLDEHLEAFTANAERAGTRVHRARDGHDAARIVIGLLRAHGATRVVKSKSMATEEIHLNAALEAAGIHPLETDLGEWIVQLAGETPSHIVVPAIHKTRREIAALFADKLGIPPTDDVAELTRTARRVLREHFAAADAGISGANAGVAETGTILIVENEGNARLTTSVPRLHVAVIGIEKIVPRLEDLDVLLQLLPRSGTGQQLTAYQSLITGVKRGDTEGPRHTDIVLLDNGRSRLLADEETRQALACIRCGACLNACPVYRQIGGHAYGSVYPGPIGAILTPQLGDLRDCADLPYASSLCDACRDVCPVKIDIPRLLLRLRAEVVEGTPAGTAGHHGPVVRRPIERLAFRAFAWSASSRARYEWTARLGRIAQRVLVRNGRIGTLGRALGALLPPLGAWTAARDLRPLAPRSFREMWEGEPQGLKARGHTGPGPLDLTASAAVRPAASDMRPAAVDTRPAARDLRPATLTERFRTAVGAVAGRCTVVADLRGAADVVQSILASHRCRRVALSDSPLVRRALDEVAFEGELVRAGDTDTFFSCDIGITAAQWGIADTGTLVLDGDAERHRLASLVPPVHVALLPASRLRATLGTVLAELAACDRDAMSRVVTFITGPSRTSDIELTLAIGVHGPGELHVIVVGDTDA